MSRLEKKDDLARYTRQIFFDEFGEEGQRRLMSSRLVIIGLGALGSYLADQLVRAGAGEVRLIDRDIVEMHNLQRQTLYSEADALAHAPKAVAAAERLRQINSTITIDAIVDDLNYRTITRYCGGYDLLIDGTDNFETRFLLNDFALQQGIPWIYGGAVAADGMAKLIVPGETACLRCLMEAPPAAGDSPTCETAGVLAATVAMVASCQVTLALKLLAGKKTDADLILLNAWKPTLRSVRVPRLEGCPACGPRAERPFLRGDIIADSAAMCGHDTVQISPVTESTIALDELAKRLSRLGEVVNRTYYLSLVLEDLELSIFPNGRCLVKGTGDEKRAKSVVNRILGG